MVETDTLTEEKKKLDMTERRTELKSGPIFITFLGNRIYDIDL